MHVSINLNGVLNKRFFSCFCFTIALLAIFFLASSYTDHSDPAFRSKNVNLIIRQIGHQLLLQSKDSSSRVLPVTESDKGTFVLSFEKRLVFNHDSLLAMTRSLLPKAKFPFGYAVTVHDCTKEDIVFGFQINNSTPDNLACSGRSQPPGCYTIEFSFPGLYANAEGKIDGGESGNYSFLYAISGSLLALLGLIFLLTRLKKTPRQHEIQTEVITVLPEYPTLGKFQFDVKGHRLIMGTETIVLTDKECKVLELLYNNIGELVPRDTLMQKVWIDEGVITGRSLDMFVSKLRKKLSPDAELGITNVHGKGYKLEYQNVTL